MFTGMDKAIVAALGSLLALVTGIGVEVPAWVTTDWISAVVGIALPVVVYFWPNKA